MKTQKKFIKLEATNPVQKEDGYVEFEYTITGDKRDRQGEILEPKGAKVDNFLKNPILLWGHNQTMGTEPLPIGKVEEIKVYDNKINCKAVIHNITQLAQEVGELVKKGFLNTMSVGFIPLERDKKDSSIITKWEMLEHSVVPVPAYQDALIYAKKMGYNEVLKTMENINIKGVIPYSVHGDGPKAPEDEEWDAGEEVAKATGDAEKLRKMHAWVDSEAENFDASERQWYKLPHHRGDGSQAVVWNGVRAAGAVLMGAHGGTNIPEGDIPGIKRHLARHYEQFDKIPPWEQEERSIKYCELCGKEYKTKPSHYARRRFCSSECFGKWLSENNIGENNPNWKRELRICKNCNQEFYIEKWRLESAEKDGKNRGIFCSSKCQQEYQVGKNNPNYKGTYNYMEREEFRKSQEWEKIRKTVMERDEYKCWLCGEKGNLCVHHIKSWNDYPELRLDETNLITLCPECHKLMHKGKNFWQAMGVDISKEPTLKIKKEIKEPPELKEYTEEELKAIEIVEKEESKEINNALDSAIKRIDEILQSRNNRNRLKVEKVQESEREEIIKEINKLTQLADKILGIVNNRIKKIR